MAVDYGTARGMVRLLISDTGETTLTDAQVDAFLSLHGVTSPTAPATGRPLRLAAASALTAIASSEVLLSKVLTTADGLRTDGAKVAAELRALAAQYRADAAADDPTDALDVSGDGYGVVEFTPYPRTVA